MRSAERPNRSPALPSTGRVRNARLTVAYDGTDFRGFAISANQRTVMGELTAAVSRVVRTPVELTGAGRTDAGVHGWGQVVSGLLPEGTDLRRLQRSVNGLCGPEIAVRAVEWAEPEFSARFSATSRCYHYDVWNHPDPNPLAAADVVARARPARSRRDERRRRCTGR